MILPSKQVSNVIIVSRNILHLIYYLYTLTVFFIVLPKSIRIRIAQLIICSIFFIDFCAKCIQIVAIGIV